MQNYRIRKSNVSSKMHSTCLIGDACFNKSVIKTFHNVCVLLCHMGFHINTVNYLEIKNSRLFNNVHLQHFKVQIMLLTKTCNLHKAFLCSFMLQSAQSKKRFFLFSPRTYGVFSR